VSIRPEGNSRSDLDSSACSQWLSSTALGEALEIMEDTMKRGLYDEGYDKEAIVERAEAARRAAHKGGHGGGCGAGGGGGGCC
jgi:hypothetical protein